MANSNMFDERLAIEVKQKNHTRWTSSDWSELRGTGTFAVDLTVATYLGGGSNGAVYRATFRGRQVAAKVSFMTLHPAVYGIFEDRRAFDMAMKSINDEIYHLSRTTDSRIVEFLGVGWTQRSAFGGVVKLPAFIVTELCSDGTLADRMKLDPTRAPPLRMLVTWLSQCAEGLAVIHASKRCHRDVKPANMVFQGDELKIADLGIAKVYDELRRATSMRASANGTPVYFAPGEGESTHPGRDTYAWGVMAAEAVLRRSPHADHAQRCEQAKEAAQLVELEGWLYLGALIRESVLHALPDRPTARVIHYLLQADLAGQGLWEEILNALPVDCQSSLFQQEMTREIMCDGADSVTFREILPNLHLGRAEDTTNSNYQLVVCAANASRWLNETLRGVELVQLPIIVDGVDVSTRAAEFRGSDVDPGSFKFGEQMPLIEAIVRIHVVLNRGGKVLVCCKQGRKQSALVVCAYLGARLAAPSDRMDNVFNFVQSKRYSASKGSSYWDFLTNEFKFDLTRQMLAQATIRDVAALNLQRQAKSSTTSESGSCGSTAATTED